MAYLSENQIEMLTRDDLAGSEVTIERKKSRNVFTLSSVVKPKHGMKGVVWKASDDIGESVAIKIIPEEEYAGTSIADEMSQAARLDSNYFADIKFFGKSSSFDNQTSYYVVVTEWIDGVTFDEYVNTELINVDKLMVLSVGLFSALGDLRNNGLCHDDLHQGNILIEKYTDGLSGESLKRIKIIDTGTLKQIKQRDSRLQELRTTIDTLITGRGDEGEISRLIERYNRKAPGDHLRVVEALLTAANGLMRNNYRLKLWERKFLDKIEEVFFRFSDADIVGRFDDPGQCVEALQALLNSCETGKLDPDPKMLTPFDFISSEMILADRQFTELFSEEIPWLDDCIALEPLWIYGPRGCGKSSILRWLSFNLLTARINNDYSFEKLQDVGVYMSCSAELRSRFFPLDQHTIDHLQKPILLYFNHLLLERLIETLLEMSRLQKDKVFDFGLSDDNQLRFSNWVFSRLGLNEGSQRLYGEERLAYLNYIVRKLKWETWSSIVSGTSVIGIPDPSLTADVCKELRNYFDYFKTRHITFLIDDYSNQRINPCTSSEHFGHYFDLNKERFHGFRMSFLRHQGVYHPVG